MWVFCGLCMINAQTVKSAGFLWTLIGFCEDPGTVVAFAKEGPNPMRCWRSCGGKAKPRSEMWLYTANTNKSTAGLPTLEASDATLRSPCEKAALAAHTASEKNRAGNAAAVLGDNRPIARASAGT